jgi:hypothetical protein
MSLKTKLRGLSPRGNYTERATAACRRSFCLFLRIESCVVSTIDHYIRILGFLDRISYLFFKVAPHLHSRGRVDPFRDPLLLRKFGSSGNRTRTSGSVARNSWPLDHRDGQEMSLACLIQFCWVHVNPSPHWSNFKTFQMRTWYIRIN